MGGDEEMNFTLIRPSRPDIEAQLTLLKPAFNGVRSAKWEFDFCCEAVKSKRASMYQLKGDGVSVRFVGYVTEENEYLVLSMTGKGLAKAAPVIIEAVRSQGYHSIKYHTVRTGMTQILKQFGFSVTEKTDHDCVVSLSLEGM